MSDPTSANVPITRIEANPRAGAAKRPEIWRADGAYLDPRPMWKLHEQRHREERKSRPNKPRVIWQAAILRYPDGSAEVSAIPRRLAEDECMQNGPLQADSMQERDPIDTDPIQKEAKPEKEAPAEDDLERAARRARSSVRKLCRAHALRNLLTFTNGAGGEGWADRAAVLDDVSRFMKVYGPAIFGPNTPMVIVAERGGKGNRWHAHVAMVDLGWIDYDMVRYFWTAFMIRRGWIPENSTWHIWHRGDEKGRFRGTAKHARHLAAYMAKYVGKSLADELGKRGSHRYRTWNAPAPLVERWRGYNWPVLRQMLGIDEDARPVVNPKTGKEYMSATGMRPIEIEGRFLGYWGDLDHVNPPPEWLDPAAMIETIWTGFGWSGFAMGCVTA